MLPSHYQYYQSSVTSGDSKKLVSSKCSLGKNDQLISPAKGFFDRFSAKRVRNTSWHHSANSPQDGRYSFTYVFRHNVRTPESRQLLIPTHVSDIAGVQTSEVEINSLVKTGLQWQDANPDTQVAPEGSLWQWEADEGRVNPLMFKEGLPGKTFYSPFCLQELESLSWNINNFKIVPSLLGHSEGALPGSVILSNAAQGQMNVSERGTSLQVKNMFASTFNVDFGANSLEADYDANALQRDIVTNTAEIAPTTDANGNQVTPGVQEHAHTIYHNSFATGFLTMKNYKYKAQQKQLDGTLPIENNNGSFVSDISRAFNAIDGKKDLGRYKVQLGQGSLSFTFVNTGDSDMIVDMVVHRPKENHAMHVLDATEGYVNTLRGPVYHGDIHDDIIDTYSVNYMDYHNRQQDRIMTTNLHKPDDIDTNPRTKFLPTTYRTPVRSKQSILEDHEAGLNVIDVNKLDPPFIDIKREKLIVPANCRKTLTVYMPARLYDPAEYNYNSVLNANGIAITFGITGKTTRAVIPAGSTGTDIQPSRFMGRQAAATSFHIYGNESQTIYPVTLIEKEDYQSNSAKLSRLSDPSNVMVSGILNPLFNRQTTSRHIEVLTDGAGGVQAASGTELGKPHGLEESPFHQVTPAKRSKIQEDNERAMEEATVLAEDFTKAVSYGYDSVPLEWTETNTSRQTALDQAKSFLKAAKDKVNYIRQTYPGAFTQFGDSVMKTVAAFNGSGKNGTGGFLAAFTQGTDCLFDPANKQMSDALIDQAFTVSPGVVTNQHIMSSDLLIGNRRLEEITILGDGGFTGLSDFDSERLARLIAIHIHDADLELKLDVNQLIELYGVDGNLILAKQDGSLFSDSWPAGGLVKGVHWDTAESVPEPHPNPAPHPPAIVVKKSEITLTNTPVVADPHAIDLQNGSGISSNQYDPTDNGHLLMALPANQLAQIPTGYFFCSMGSTHAYTLLTNDLLRYIVSSVISDMNVTTIEDVTDVKFKLYFSLASDGSSPYAVEFTFTRDSQFTYAPAPMAVTGATSVPVITMTTASVAYYTNAGVFNSNQPHTSPMPHYWDAAHTIPVNQNTTADLIKTAVEANSSIQYVDLPLYESGGNQSWTLRYSKTTNWTVTFA